MPYALVTSFTPGPNNILALYSVSQNGWKKGKNTVLGIFLGFMSVMIICAVLCYWLAKYIPSLTNILKYVGCIYILWLALHIARSKPGGSGGSEVSFFKSYLLQFVNVKIIMYAMTIFTGYVLNVSTSFSFMLSNAVCLPVFGAAGTITWALAGGIFQKFLSKYYKPFNLLMALILVACAVKIVLNN